jgi:hypothetical protein
MNHGRQERDGDGNEAGRAADGSHVEQAAAHQWNICTVWG